MNKLNKLGFFNDNTAFYLMWAEHLAQQHDRKQFDAVRALCEKNCRLNQQKSNALFK